MKFEYECLRCKKVVTNEVMVSKMPDDWDPPEQVSCECGQFAVRQYGCAVGIQDNRDQMKHVGQSLSNQRGVEFIGTGWSDAERKLDQETEEIGQIMDEPVTPYDIEAGKQQMVELEKERGKTQGFYSGDREQHEVEFVGVSEDDQRQAQAKEASKLKKEVNRIDVTPENAAEISKQYGVQPLKPGQSTKKVVQKRRGSEAMKKDVEKAKTSRGV